MNIFRTHASIQVRPVEVFEDGAWRRTELKSDGGIILTQVTDEEHDRVIDLQMDGLRGYRASLVLQEPDHYDPTEVDLVGFPAKGQVIRHKERFYLINLVMQDTSFRLTVFVTKVLAGDLNYI